MEPASRIAPGPIVRTMFRSENGGGAGKSSFSHGARFPNGMAAGFSFESVVISPVFYRTSYPGYFFTTSTCKLSRFTPPLLIDGNRVTTRNGHAVDP